MNRRTVLSALLVPFLLVAGCGDGKKGEESAVPSDAIVSVNGKVLTERYLEDLLPAGEKTPFSDSEKAAWVRQWIEMELLCGEAVRRGLDNDPRVRARLESLEREYLADHLTFIELRERIEVSEEEIEEYFEEHKDEYANEYRVSHIMVNTLEEARQVQELLKKNSFTWVANRYSVDPVAKRGGDLGYLTKGNMIPAFETVVFDMQPGEVSGIIQSEFGYHIIMLVGMREAQVKIELADVREMIMNELVLRKREAAYRELMEKLFEKADIRYFNGGYPEEGVQTDTAIVEEPSDTAATDTMTTEG
jgi:peptidyl-prolyl cis-trans isomerase C